TRAWLGIVVRGAPSNRSSPAGGARRPAMTRIRVVLPAPLLPRRAMTVPRPMPRLTPSRTRTAPYPASMSVQVRRSALMPAPEIGIDDAGVARDAIGGALRDHLAVVQHHQPFGQPHQRRHDMLDHQHGEAMATAQRGDQRRGFRRL